MEGWGNNFWRLSPQPAETFGFDYLPGVIPMGI